MALGPFTPTDDLDVADILGAGWRELRAAAGHAAGAVAEDARDAADVMLGDGDDVMLGDGDDVMLGDAADVMLGEGDDVILGDDAWKDAADGALCSDGTADGILDALTGAEPDYFFFVLVG